MFKISNNVFLGMAYKISAILWEYYKKNEKLKIGKKEAVRFWW